jgi:hypothetical protein
MAIVTASITLLRRRLARLRALLTQHLTLQRALLQCVAQCHKYQSVLSWGCTASRTLQSTRRWSPAHRSLTQCSPCRRIARAMTPTLVAPEAAGTGCSGDSGPRKSCDRHSIQGRCSQLHRIARGGRHKWQIPSRQRQEQSCQDGEDGGHFACTEAYVCAAWPRCIWPELAKLQRAAIAAHSKARGRTQSWPIGQAEFALLVQRPQCSAGVKSKVNASHVGQSVLWHPMACADLAEPKRSLTSYQVVRRTRQITTADSPPLRASCQAGYRLQSTREAFRITTIQGLMYVPVRPRHSAGGTGATARRWRV